MAVQFIFGRSGTGKTSCCIKAVVSSLLEPNGQNLILLVPEQATYQAECAILADERIAGYNRLSVLSFDRLQFLLLGKNRARPVLSRVGRQMIVHRLLRENKRKLKVFNASTDSPGLSYRITQTIAELNQYAKTPADIVQLLDELKKDERYSSTVLKFNDIKLIFEEYLKFIRDDFLDPDVQLAEVCRAVERSDFTKGAKLWIDGFAGFTTAELKILTELLKVAADTQIALCLDPSSIDLTNFDCNKLDPLSLFSPTERTYGDLIEIIKKNKLKLVEPIILSEAVRFSDCLPLAHIERKIFDFKASKTKDSDNIRIVSAPSERAEVRFVAKQIVDLVRERNFRYRDVAIIASDIGRYEHYIRAYFQDYDIPFFIDKRKSMRYHPLVQLVCSALGVITTGFNHNDIFSYLKSDLVPIERSEIDLVENYCLAFGLTDSDWQSDKKWQFAPPEDESFDDQQINEIRGRIAGPLLKLSNSLKSTGDDSTNVSAEKFTQAVYSFLEDLKVRQTLEVWIEQANDDNDAVAVDEHQHFFNKFIDIFDELVEVFSGGSMTIEDYLAIIKSAFSQVTLAFIPPTLDQVLVGSIERSRHPDLKAVFLIGATQKNFPVPLGSDTIFSDDDRKTAEQMDFQLASTSSQMLTERRYLSYIAFTRASQFLYVSYPSVDEKGSTVSRSQFITELESLFEDLHEEPFNDGYIDVEDVNTETELLDLICCGLGKDGLVNRVEQKGRLKELLDKIYTDQKLSHVGSNALYAVNYNNAAQLDTDIAKQLFGSRISSSATRLGTYAACPYQYFAKYVLELKERAEFKFEPLDIGNFYHRILDSLLKQINSKGKGLAAIDNNELLEFLREQIDKLVTEDSFISHFIAHRGYNLYIIHSASRILENCVLAVAQMVRAGDFRPQLSEVPFGRFSHSIQNQKHIKTLGDYELKLSDGRVLLLNGKIDRIDIADVDNEKIAAVFDYKRKKTSFSWSKFYHGLDLQLPIYMLAVLNTKFAGIQNIAGAFYFPIEVSLKEVTLDKLSIETDSYDYKANGILNGTFCGYLDSGASGDSKFYNFYVTKDGQPFGSYGNRGALRPDDFEKMLGFARRKIIELAEEIVSGKIGVYPYRIGTSSPCGYCKYMSVCRFDWQVNDYNFLESLKKLQVLERIGTD